MLEQISGLVKRYGEEAVVNNPDIPAEQNNAVMAEATQTITYGMQNMLAGGGLQDIISMFTGGGGNNTNTNSRGGIGNLLKNPIVMMMVGHLVSKLISKFKMNPAQANRVSNSLIPNVLGEMVNRTADTDPSNDAFDMNSLIGSLTGGNVSTSENSNSGFNFQQLLGQLTGGQTNAGGFDMQELISQVTKGAQESKAQEAQEPAGFGKLIHAFFN
jgi:hypothetical protein